jgi:hypothetical protein
MDWRGGQKLDEVRKMERGRKDVELGRATFVVLLEVREHVNQRIANGSRTRERTPVPAVRNEPASASEQLIDLPRNPDGQPAHPFDQCSAIARFDD